MIVTILGGSAPSTVCLIDYLSAHHPGNALTIRLAGRTASHLSSVARACRLLSQGIALRIESYLRPEWDSALDGADRVVIQIREGGLEGRLYDETFPRRYGIPGDEGLGPGGLNAAIRTWPVLREILRSIECRAPSALTLLLTSPAGLLVRCVQEEFPALNLAAICELPWTTLQSITREEVTFGYTGVNHLGWLHDIENHNRPLVTEPVPLKYLRLHFDPESALQIPSRAPLLMELRARAFHTFAAGTATEIRDVLALRPAPWYTHAVGPLIANVTAQPYFLTRPHVRGERAYRWTGSTFEALPCPSSHPDLQAFVERFLAYEEAAFRTVLQPSIPAIERALQAHPWVPADAPVREITTSFSSIPEPACLV